MKKVLGTALGAAGTIAILTLLSRAMGFVRAWVQNGALGDSLAGEAYSTANTVPNVLFEIAAGGALAAAVIPLVSGFLAKALAAEVSRTASALFTWVLAIGIPVAGIVTLGARPIMDVLLGEGSPAASVEFAATLLRIFAWQIPLYGLSVVCTGLLQAHKKFVLPALAPLLSSVTVIITFLIFTQLAAGQQHDPARISRTALYVLAWGTTAGVAVFSLPQLIPVLRRITLRPTFRFPPGVGRRALRLSAAGLAGLLAQQIQIIAVMLFANARGDVGTYPVFTFANQLYMVPYAVLAVPIATAVFPRLAEAAAIPGRPGLARITARSSRLVFDIGLLCVALLVAVAEPAQALFAVARPVAHMDIAMLAMAPALLGYAFIYHGSRVLYAVEAARAVIIVNSAAWLMVVVVLIGAAGLGVHGRTEVLISIGVAMSTGMTVGGIGHIFAIRRAVGPGALRGVGYSLRIVLPAAVVAGTVGYTSGRGILRWWGEGALGALGATAVAGALTLAIGGVALYFVDRRALRLARDAEAPSTQEMPAIAVAFDEANA